MQITTFEKLSKFFSLIKYDKKNYFFHFLQSIIRGINPIIHVIFIERIIFTLTKNDFLLLENTLIFYICTIVGYEILWIFTRKLGWVITIPNTETKIYEMYLSKFIKMDNNAIEKLGTGKTIAILENGRLRWGEGVVNVLEKGTSLTILLVYACIVTINHNLIFTLGFFVLLIISVTVLFFVNKYQFRYRNKRSELRNNRLRLITKVLMSKNEILQTNKINIDLDKIAKINQEMSKVNVDMSNGRTIQNRFIPFMVGLSLFVFVFISSKYVLSGNMSISEFVGITSIFLVINSSILNFTAFYIDLTKDFIDIEKMWDFFENTPSLEGYESGKTFECIKGDFEIRNLNYGYNDNKKVFENFDLKIEGQKILALVGNSGGGKTTLVKLLAGYIRQDCGEIIVDNQNIKDISLKSYYQNIGYLTQDPSVFDGTVLENLTYGINVGNGLKPFPTEELNQIIKLSKCEFIYELPNGLDTEIGERGVKLSGGQKQRLAIAKIMLKNPKIIFLDEPTSALDSFSEDKITKAMNNLFKDRTVIIVAHRLQTVKHADKIIVIEGGKVVEEGNHISLIKQNGIYKKMLDLQRGF